MDNLSNLNEVVTTVIYMSTYCKINGRSWARLFETVFFDLNRSLILKDKTQYKLMFISLDARFTRVYQIYFKP